MSGIFKGDSIYKSGGGGGGYKDGGQLVDGDFIKVENNTVSSYDNVSRDPINFYFDIAEGEVINSVIQITTQVNSTVNVYVVRNGLYFLLGNTNGNTVLANEDYEITCTGNSFEIEQVNDLSEDPVFAYFYGRKILVFPYGDYLISEDLGQWYALNELKELVSNSDGWNLISHLQWIGINSHFGNNALRSTSGWNNTQGTNSSGLNFYPYGTKVDDTVYDQGVYSYFWKLNDGYGNIAWISEGTYSETTFGSYNKARGRIIKKYKNL